MGNKGKKVEIHFTFIFNITIKRTSIQISIFYCLFEKQSQAEIYFLPEKLLSTRAWYLFVRPFESESESANTTDFWVFLFGLLDVPLLSRLSSSYGGNY